MKDTIWLRCDRIRVLTMTKTQPALRRGEIPVKLIIEVEEGAYREPVIEKQITIVDWREGIDFADVELHEATITEAEAEMIRQSRIRELVSALERRGYKVSEPDCTHGDDCQVHPGGLGCDG